MTTLQIISAVSLSIVGLCAASAIFCRHFHDNWLQFVGLAGIACWSSARVLQLTDLIDGRMPGQGTIMHVALALYGVGTAVKVWKHRPRNPSAPPVPPTAPGELDVGQMRHVVGGSSR